MQEEVNRLQEYVVRVGVKINIAKRESMNMHDTHTHTPTTIHQLERLISFISGVHGNHKRRGDADLLQTMQKARCAFMPLKEIWKLKKYNTKTKLGIFDSNVKAVLLFECESWKINKK